MLQTLKKSETHFRFNPYAKDYLDDPYAIYHYMRQHYPIYKYKTFSNEQSLITRYDDIKYVLVDKKFKVEDLSHTVPDVGQMIGTSAAALDLLEQSLQPWLFFLNPPDHTRLRNTVNREFTVLGIQKIRPYIEEVVSSIFNTLKESKQLEVMSILAKPLPVQVSAKMLGLTLVDVPQLIEHSEILFSIFEQPLTLSGYQSMVVSAEYFKELITRELKRRERSNEKNDLLDILLSSKENILSEKELLGFSGMLFSVGQETTENYIGNAILALMENPDQFDLLCRKPEWIENAVMELARYDTAVQFISRVADCDVEMSGREIHKGDRLYLVMGSANRDERRYENPDRLDIQRQGIGNLPFGSGIHFCLGRALAKLQVEVVLQHMMQFPNLKLDRSSVKRRKTAVIRGVKEMRLYLD